MSTLRFEAWTYPGSASYAKRFEFYPAGGSGQRELSDYSDETITVRADFDRLSDIISSSNRSTIKVLLGSTVIDEFTAERVKRNLDRPGLVDISGIQRNGWIEGIGVYPYRDIEGSQDWHWGSEDNRLDNPSGEDPAASDNIGFEDGTTSPWRAGAVPGVSANLFLETSDVDTGTYAARCVVLIAEGGMSRNYQLYPANFYTVNARIKGTMGIDYQVGASGPETVHEVAGNSTRVEVAGSPGGYEVQHEFTASGSYEDVTLVFGTAGDQTSTQLSIREAPGGPAVTFRVDDVTISGFGIGAEPWQATKPNQPGIPGVSVLEASQDVSHPDTSWVLKCTAPYLEGAYQAFIGNTPGERLTFTVDVRGTSADLWTVGLRDVNGNQIGVDQTVTLPTGSFTTVTGTVDLPDFIAGADNELRLQLTNHSGGESTIYWAKASVAQGDPAATFTQIVRELLEDAQSRGTATWLELDADDTQDTLGTSLSAISFSAFTGNNAHMGHVMDDGADIGYHWRIVPAADAQIITPTGTHVLQVFATTEVEDLTASAGGPYIFAGSASEGETVDRIPPFTALLALGEGGSKLEDTDATEVTAIGRIERVRDVEHLPESSLQLYLDSEFSEEAANRKAARGTVLGSARQIPGIDYTEGSKVWWSFGEILPREARTVRRWTWSHAEPARFEVFGSEVLTPEAAQAKALDHLLNVLERRALRQRRTSSKSLSDSFSTIGTGGTPTFFVAASDASVHSREIADFLCDGTNDEVQINAAIAALPAGGGRVLLSEGTFYIGAAVIINTDHVVLEMLQSALRVDADSINVIEVTDFEAHLIDVKIINPSLHTGVTGCHINYTTNNTATPAGVVFERFRVDDLAVAISDDAGSYAYRCHIFDSSFFTCSGSAVIDLNGTGDVRVMHNWFVENTSTDIINITGTWKGLVTDNFLWNNTGGGSNFVLPSTVAEYHNYLNASQGVTDDGGHTTSPTAGLIDATAYGVVADCVGVNDAAVAGGSLSTVTSATAGFTSADTGKTFTLASTAGAVTTGTLTYVSATSCTMSTPAGGAMTGARLIYGTDDTTAWQNALDAASPGQAVDIPSGTFRSLCTGQLDIPDGVTLGRLGRGPFDPQTNPAMNDWGPTFVVVQDASTAFVSLNDGSGLGDFIFYSANQVPPTATTATTFAPFVLTVGNDSAGSAGCRIGSIYMPNASQGVELHGGRHQVDYIQVGALHNGVVIDYSQDVVGIDRIQVSPYWRICEGQTYTPTASTLDEYALDNATGLKVHHSDSFRVTHFFSFGIHTGIWALDSPDTMQSERYGYGFVAMADVDNCAFGVRADSTETPGVHVAQLIVGANGTGVGTAGQSALRTTTGGVSTPLLIVTEYEPRGSWVSEVDEQAGEIRLGGVASLGLDDLTDVTISGAAEGDLIQRIAGEFVNVQATDVGHYELLVTGSSPPENLEDGTGNDWLYVWVT